MYKDLEEMYKREGIYNKLMKQLTINLSITIPIALVLTFIKINFVFVLICTMLATLISTLITIAKILNVKITVNIKNDIINEIANQKKQDNIKIEKYLKNNDLYNKDTIKTMIEHYRYLIPLQQKTSNFWSILAIIYTIATGFYDKKKNLNIDFLFYSLIIFIICLGFHKIYKILCIYIDCLKGRDGLFEGLEEILSEIYSELVYKEEKQKQKSKPSKIKKK